MLAVFVYGKVNNIDSKQGRDWNGWAQDEMDLIIVVLLREWVWPIFIFSPKK